MSAVGRRRPRAGSTTGPAATATAGWSWPSSSSPTSWTCSTPRSPTSPARDPRRPRRQRQHAAVGAGGVHAGLRGRPDHLGPGSATWSAGAGCSSSAWPASPSPRCCAGWRRPRALIAARVAAGPVRRRDDPAGPGDGEAVVPARRAAEGVHPVRPGHGAGRGARPDPRRLADRRRPVRLRLADDLPHQRADRHGRASSSPGATCPRSAPTAATRLDLARSCC